jgi:hypothetical protein
VTKISEESSSLEDNVRNVYELLKEKKIAIERLRREIAALRLVVPLLHDEGDFIPGNFEPVVGQERTSGIPVSEEIDGWLAPIRSLLLDEERMGYKGESGRSVRLQFMQTALGASRTFFKRVLDSPLLEHEPQRNTIRDLFERLGRTNAA